MASMGRNRRRGLDIGLKSSSEGMKIQSKQSIFKNHKERHQENEKSRFEHRYKQQSRQTRFANSRKLKDRASTLRPQVKRVP